MSTYDIKNHDLKMQPRTFAALIITLFLSWAPLFVIAAPKSDLKEERWFQVELILFAHQNGKAMEAEKWPDIEGLVLPEKLLELTLPTPEPLSGQPLKDPAGDILPADSPQVETFSTAEKTSLMPIAHQLLKAEALQLGDTMKKLQRAKHFKPLLHVAWQQPTVDAQQAKPVFLFEGMADPLPVEDTASKPLENTDQESASLKPIFTVEENANTGPKNPRLVGTVRLSVARYLHLAADLVYRAPVTQQEAIPVSDLDLWYDHPHPTLYDPQGPAYQLKEWQATRGFRLQESRRMRSKEIHYLDHPFFGMIVLVTPVELPKKTLDPQEEIYNPTSLTPPSIKALPASTNKNQ